MVSLNQKHWPLLLFFLLLTQYFYAQPSRSAFENISTPCPTAPADHQLADLANKAQQKVTSFFETISELGTNEKSAAIKAIYIQNTTKLFVTNGTVEERSKYQKSGVIRNVAAYLASIKARGENSRIVINYEITDPLLPNKLVCTEEGDQLILKGSITVRQYYCKLKKYAKPSDNFDDEAQCDYWDITDKKINIEMKLMKTVNGYGWVVLINSITVLKVK